MESGILWQNADSTILVIDIPRSIEAAQGSNPSTRRLLSSEPLAKAYPSVEPKSAKAKARFGIPSLEELLLRKHLEFALEEVRVGYSGDWCLPRVVDGLPEEFVPRKKQKRHEGSSGDLNQQDEEISQALVSGLETLELDGLLYTNHESGSKSIRILGEDSSFWIPQEATFINGEISSTITTFTASAPLFKLVVLDPAWPNRSARRKKDYSISYGTSEIRKLLSSIPLYNHLKDDGVIAIWTTNKEVFRETVLGPDGLFEEWGVGLAEEWIWIKATTQGEPMGALDSVWRKPYEVLLLGRRGAVDGDVKRRVIVGVPDLHSRKPNLKALFEKAMLVDVVRDKDQARGKYEALEIFARNLNAGWWSWGNEVLKFQKQESWVDE